MHRDLGVQRMRAQTAMRVVQRKTGFIAGGFNAKNNHREKAGYQLVAVRTGGCDACAQSPPHGPAKQPVRYGFSPKRAVSLHGLSKQSLLIAPRLTDTYFEPNALSD
jgi:hypothetical protein